MHFALAATALAAVATSAHAGLIVDTAFNDADWTLHQSAFFAPGSSASASQAIGAGYTGSARRAANSLAGNLSGIYGINVLASTGWDGSAALEDLTLSIYSRQEYGLQALGFAIEQGGSYWIAGYFLNTWSYSLYETSATAADFVVPYGVDPSSQAANPDFSAGAAPIRFGFYVANSSSAGGGAYGTSGLYSDFTVSFVPAPGVLGAFAVAGVAGFRRRR